MGMDFDTQTHTRSPLRIQTLAKHQVTASWNPSFLKSLVLSFTPPLRRQGNGGLAPPSETPAPRGALRLPPASPHRHDGEEMDGLSPPSVNDSASWRTKALMRSRPAGQK